MARGRLIFPLIAEIAQLDTEATALDPDGPNDDTLTSGYDDIFKEPSLIAPEPDIAGAPAAVLNRCEKVIRCKAQLESRNFDLGQEQASGTSPGARIVLVFHFRNLEAAGLIDPDTGRALINRQDRLAAVYHQRTGKLIQSFPEKPGLYAQEILPSSFGLTSLERNLLIVTFEDREQSTERV